MKLLLSFLMQFFQSRIQTYHSILNRLFIELCLFNFQFLILIKLILIFIILIFLFIFTQILNTLIILIKIINLLQSIINYLIITKLQLPLLNNLTKTLSTKLPHKNSKHFPHLFPNQILNLPYQTQHLTHQDPSLIL